MTADPTLEAPKPTDAARGQIAAQMALLTDLAEIGMEMARGCGREAKVLAEAAEQGTPVDPASRRDPSLAFARVARAVRLTIALQRHLAKDLVDLDKQDRSAESTRRLNRRLHMSALVHEAAQVLVTAQRKADGVWVDDDYDDDEDEDPEVEAMSDAAYERLTDAEDGYLKGRPFDEVVAHICRDLGMDADAAARLMAVVERPDPLTSPCFAGGLIGEEPIMGPSAEEPMVEGESHEPQRYTCVWLDGPEPPAAPP